MCAAMRNYRGPSILEGLATRDVVVMVVAVDQVLDRRVGHLPNFLDNGYCRQRPAVADGVGCDHACQRDNEHRLGSGRN